METLTNEYQEYSNSDTHAHFLQILVQKYNPPTYPTFYT